MKLNRQTFSRRDFLKYAATTSIIIASPTLCVNSCLKDSHFKVRGVVLGVNDLRSLNWPELAFNADLTTIGTHCRPKEVTEFFNLIKVKNFRKIARNIIFVLNMNYTQ